MRIGIKIVVNFQKVIRSRYGGKDGEEKLTNEEIEQQLQNLKRNKAKGTDGMSGEANSWQVSKEMERIISNLEKVIIVPISKKVL